MMNYVYTLPLDATASNLATTGGKGNNLGILSRSNNTTTGIISVPNGFTVTVAAYRDFCAENKLQETIQDALLLLQCDKKKNESSETAAALLEQASLQIRNAFRQAKVSKMLKLEIASRLENLIPNVDDVNYLAIRSSATCEDMPDASFAGQHDTFLNVARGKGVNHVCAYIVDCFGSLFTSRAIAYRQRYGISHLQAGMAVVVQELVPSDCSGVLFTANPLTGRRCETVLEAIPGLGEALVSGLTEPDRYVISRVTSIGKDNSNDGQQQQQQQEAFRIKDVRVGAKRTAIRPVKGGGVVQQEETTRSTTISCTVDDEQQQQQQQQESATTVLSNDEVMELVELGQKLEALFDGTPQDVEWARSNGKTFVVQSRPITTLFPCPKVPATAEKNAPPRPLQIYFSFGAVQGFQAPCFPAGCQALRNALGGLIRYVTWGRKGKRTSDGGEFFQVVAERIYINVTPVLHNSIGRKFYGKFLPAVEPSLLRGIQELLPIINVNNDDDSGGGGMSLFMFLRIASIMCIVVPRFLYTFLFPQHSRKGFIRIMNEKVASIKQQADKANTSSLAQIVQVKEKSLESFFPFMIFRFVPRMAAGMGPLYLLSRLASSIPNGKDLALTITRGLPHNVTTEMDLKLWEVAKTIRSNDEALEFIRGNNADVLAEIYQQGKLPRVAQNAIGSFLDVYGMRGLYEIDFGRPRWREEPAPVFQTIKSYIEIDNDNAPDRVFAKGEIAANQAIEELGRALGKPWLVRFLAHRTRSIAGVRELPKFTAIRIMGIFREKYLEHGERLVRAGTLDSPRDVFFLDDDELISIDNGGGGDRKDWKAVVAQRKAVMDKENGRMAIPRVIASDGFAFYGGAFASKDYSDGDDAFVGEPVSPGSVEGIVHIVHDPSKSSLQPGEILVCHGTDPSWTPLFLAARGLVMEVGGLMTHGSVVAREYGIPAVVGLEKITERLQNGQRIRVDGSSGVVSIILDQQKEEEKEIIAC